MVPSVPALGSQALEVLALWTAHRVEGDVTVIPIVSYRGPTEIDLTGGLNLLAGNFINRL